MNWFFARAGLNRGLHGRQLGHIPTPGATFPSLGKKWVGSPANQYKEDVGDGLSSLSENTWTSNHLQMPQKRQQIFLSYFKILRIKFHKFNHFAKSPHSEHLTAQVSKTISLSLVIRISSLSSLMYLLGIGIPSSSRSSSSNSPSFAFMSYPLKYEGKKMKPFPLLHFRIAHKFKA